MSFFWMLHLQTCVVIVDSVDVVDVLLLTWWRTSHTRGVVVDVDMLVTRHMPAGFGVVVHIVVDIIVVDVVVADRVVADVVVVDIVFVVWMTVALKIISWTGEISQVYTCDNVAQKKIALCFLSLLYFLTLKETKVKCNAAENVANCCNRLKQNRPD